MPPKENASLRNEHTNISLRQSHSALNDCTEYMAMGIMWTDMSPLSQVRVTSAKLSELLLGVRAKSRSQLSGRRDRLLARTHIHKYISALSN